MHTHTRTHTSVHLLHKFSHTHTALPHNPIALLYRCSGGFSVAVELHTGARPVVLSSILRSRIRPAIFTAARPLLLVSSFLVCVSVCLSLCSLCLSFSVSHTHSFFPGRCCTHTSAHTKARTNECEREGERETRRRRRYRDKKENLVG